MSEQPPGDGTKAYRIYALEQDARIARPPVIIDCDSDEEAVARAAALLDGKTLLVWERARLVARIEPEA